jgi:hypothetical protein
MIILKRFKIYINYVDTRLFINERQYGIALISLNYDNMLTKTLILYYNSYPVVNYHRTRPNVFNEEINFGMSVKCHGMWSMVTAKILDDGHYIFSIIKSKDLRNKKIISMEYSCLDEHDKEGIILKFPLIQ